MAKVLPSQELLQEFFTYCPESGELSWKERDRSFFINYRAYKIWNARSAGKIAGSIESTGYRKVVIFGTPFLAHRIIWKHQTGKEPHRCLDHINGDRADNKWVNLREASSSQNSMNQDVSSKNTSGFKGVSFSTRKRKWGARISCNNIRRRLGYFDTAEEAHAAYRKVALELHGEFANFG